MPESIKIGDIVLIYNDGKSNKRTRAQVTDINGKISTVKTEDAGEIVEVLTDTMELAPMRIEFVDTVPSPIIKRHMEELEFANANLIKSAKIPMKKFEPASKKRINFRKNKNTATDSAKPTDSQLLKLMERFNGR